MATKKSLYDQGMDDYQSLIDQEGVNYRNAVREGNDEEAKRAWQSIAAWRVQMREAHAIAMEEKQAGQPPPSAPVRGGQFRMEDKDAEAAAARLTDDQIEAAAIAGISEKEYARNYARMLHLKATGQIG